MGVTESMATDVDEEAPIGSNLQRLWGLPCCPCSRYTAKCVRTCPCKQRGVHCSSCGPLLLDCCHNCGTIDTASLSHPTHDRLLLADDGCPRPEGVDTSGQYTVDLAVEPQKECGADDIFLHEKFEWAFGAPLLNHDRGFDCEVCSL